tara:strand:- start:2974 stop:3195 length:222 start_codon:yes stop_codon:yes gene_type:complete
MNIEVRRNDDIVNEHRNIVNRFIIHPENYIYIFIGLIIILSTAGIFFKDIKSINNSTNIYGGKQKRKRNINIS